MGVCFCHVGVSCTVVPTDTVHQLGWMAEKKRNFSWIVVTTRRKARPTHTGPSVAKRKWSARQIRHLCREHLPRNADWPQGQSHTVPEQMYTLITQVKKPTLRLAGGKLCGFLLVGNSNPWTGKLV